ncbi:MAG TPA: RcnB family protein [Allosphingosinicella sp.]|jgi:Ni/Co efflux regulator RcnB
MRKLILMSLMAAVAIPSAASAQSRGEIRHDRREVREERQELREARRFGDRRDVREERRELQGARRELREDRADRRRTARYVSPYSNWSYRPVGVGYNLRPAFYGSRYHVSNYGQFGVRQPGRFQQWVRYGDDLLLVNVRTGRVLQVIRSRYW